MIKLCSLYVKATSRTFYTCNVNLFKTFPMMQLAVCHTFKHTFLLVDFEIFSINYKILILIKILYDVRQELQCDSVILSNPICILEH